MLGLMLVLHGLMSQVYDLLSPNSVGRFFFDSEDGGGTSHRLQVPVTAVAFLSVYDGFLRLLVSVFAQLVFVAAPFENSAVSREDLARVSEMMRGLRRSRPRRQAEERLAS